MDQNNLTPQPTPTIVQPAPVQPGSKALGVWALVLAILAILTSAIAPFAVPLAIIAIILAIISLAKRRPAKGMSIASIIIAGITMIVSPIVTMIFLSAFSGVAEKAQEVQSSQKSLDN